MEKYLDKIARWYDRTLLAFGTSPQGVGWSTEKDQRIRFEQLTKLIEKEEYICNDLGCGYGALLNFLKEVGKEPIAYYGYDLSRYMVQNARSIVSKNTVSIFEGTRLETLADYTFASGTFNIKLNAHRGEWEWHIAESIQDMAEHSMLGFGVNFLTKSEDSRLYVASANEWSDFCSIYGKVTCLMDYIDGDVTILVKKANI